MRRVASGLEEEMYELRDQLVQLEDEISADKEEVAVSRHFSPSSLTPSPSPASLPFKSLKGLMTRPDTGHQPRIKAKSEEMWEKQRVLEELAVSYY